jgi:hypothetical protein
MTLAPRMSPVWIFNRQDANSSSNEAFYNLNRWIGIRVSWCTALIGGAAGFIALASKGFSPGLIGFSLTNSLAFSGSVLSSVRCLNAVSSAVAQTVERSANRFDSWRLN